MRAFGEEVDAGVHEIGHVRLHAFIHVLDKESFSPAAVKGQALLRKSNVIVK